MITKICGRGFKGLDFDQELGQNTLFIGPNGAGKSARTQALTLAILGYLPQDQVKQAGAILDIHGADGEMEVGAEIDGNTSVKRKYKRKKDGAATQEFYLNSKKLSQREIDRAILQIGDPRIFDLKEFNNLSDAKKIDFIFERFPPKGDYQKINADIVHLEETERRLRAERKATEQVIQNLTRERAKIQLPAGTLAEVQAEIAEKESEVANALEDLKQAEADERVRRETEEAKRREEEARRETEEALKWAEDAEQREEDAIKRARAADAQLKELREKNLEAIAEEKPDVPIPHDPITTISELSPIGEMASNVVRQDCLKALHKIKGVLLSAGCSECAALIVTNAEISKIKKGGGENE